MIHPPMNTPNITLSYGKTLGKGKELFIRMHMERKVMYGEMDFGFWIFEMTEWK